MFTAVAIAGIAIFSYLIGSVNSAIIVSRVFAKDDVRSQGSGNAGMTNMLRTYGKGPAIITASGDFLKAIIAIVLSRLVFKWLGISFIDAGYISGLFVVLGHVYPVFFGFRGGKGVMTTLATIFAVNPLVFLIIALIFVPLVLATKIVSLGSVLGAISYPILTYVIDLIRQRPPLYDTVFALIYMALILYMHRSNIKRLLNGTENKFGSKKM